MSYSTIPNLGVAVSLNGSEQVWVVQDGEDKRTTTGAIGRFAASPLSVLITASGQALVPWTFYAVRTSLGTFGGTLPPLGSVASASYVEIADADNNAGINNYTVTANGSDQISDHGVLSSTSALNVSNTITRFIASASSWTVITYGM